MTENIHDLTEEELIEANRLARKELNLGPVDFNLTADQISAIADELRPKPSLMTRIRNKIEIPWDIIAVFGVLGSLIGFITFFWIELSDTSNALEVPGAWNYMFESMFSWPGWIFLVGFLVFWLMALGQDDTGDTAMGACFFTVLGAFVLIFPSIDAHNAWWENGPIQAQVHEVFADTSCDVINVSDTTKGKGYVRTPEGSVEFWGTIPTEPEPVVISRDFDIEQSPTGPRVVFYENFTQLAPTQVQSSQLIESYCP